MNPPVPPNTPVVRMAPANSNVSADIRQRYEAMPPTLNSPQLDDLQASSKQPPVTPSSMDLSPLRFAHTSISDDTVADVDPIGEASHFGEIRGLVRTYVGKRLTIEPLVATTAKMPDVGSKGELWVNIGAKEDNYVLLARVRVASAVVAGATLDLDILDDENTGQAVILMQSLQPGRGTRLEYTW